MGIFKSLFSSEDTVNKATDAIISTGDKLFYTDEEKADMRLKLGDLHIKMLEAAEPFRLAQRYIAIWFSLLFGTAFVIGLLIAIFNMISTYRQTISGVLKENIVTISLDPLFALMGAFGMVAIMGIILAWYFSGGVIGSLKRGSK